MNLSTVKWAQWDKTQSRELLGLFICVCIALCTIVAHYIAQNRPDNFSSYPPDNHHCSDDVYLREGIKEDLTQQQHTFTNQKKRTTTQNKHTKKTKARFSHLLWHPASKRRGPFWFRRFTNLSLIYLDTYQLTYSPGPHTVQMQLCDSH